MTTALGHEAYVASRFDRLRERFPDAVAPEDVRRDTLLSALGPIDGRLILDFGAGNGRFSTIMEERGARVVALDRSQGMLARCPVHRRVCAGSRRLPFADGVFDAIVVVEVFQHVPEPLGPTFDEFERVLRPGGRLVILDKNAGSLDADRPWLPSLALKWIDERRGFWMYPADGPVRERWFWPRRFAGRLARIFDNVQVEHPLMSSEARHGVFRNRPRRRLLTLWTARKRSEDA